MDLQKATGLRELIKPLISMMLSVKVDIGDADTYITRSYIPDFLS